MSYTPPPLLGAVIENGFTQTVFSVEMAQALTETAKALGQPANIHIKIDTGMGRLGFLPTKQTADALCKIWHQQESLLRVTGIYTHFATSDALDTGFMHEQYARFQHLLSLLRQRGVPVDSVCQHVGNSGFLAQMHRPQNVHAPACAPLHMMRIGILLYGLPPSTETNSITAQLGLQPAMKLMSRVSMVKTLPPGSGVSYGHLFCTQRETRVATLPIGYADGYPRLLSNKGRVQINGHLAPIIGAICMDQCMVDVTDVPGEIAPGHEVCLFGVPGICADDLAATIGTIGYELLCGVGKRVPRMYI